MLTVQRGPMTGLVGQLALLGVLAATVGLGPAGWVVGIACGVTRRGPGAWPDPPRSDRLGPADRVTLARATLVCGVAALVADSLGRPAPVPALVGLTAVALVLDGVDGRVARRTGTASRARRAVRHGGRRVPDPGAQRVRRPLGRAWVLAIGAARYPLLAAGWLLPWLRRTDAAALLVQGRRRGPGRRAHRRGRGRRCRGAVTDAALVVALALLAESFGREVVVAVAAPGRRRRRGPWSRACRHACGEHRHSGPERRRRHLARLRCWSGSALTAPDRLEPTSRRPPSSGCRSRPSCSSASRSCCRTRAQAAWRRWSSGVLLGLLIVAQGARHGLLRGARTGRSTPSSTGPTSGPRSACSATRSARRHGRGAGRGRAARPRPARRSLPLSLLRRGPARCRGIGRGSHRGPSSALAASGLLLARRWTCTSSRTHRSPPPARRRTPTAR